MPTLQEGVSSEEMVAEVLFATLPKDAVGIRESTGEGGEGRAMKERPIIMTPENAQKVYEGTKTQTRRTKGLEEVNSSRLWDYPQMTRPGVATFLDSTQANPYNNALDVKCPYGQAGDRLWIREAWARSTDPANDPLHLECVLYKGANDKAKKWKPSIHMPRWACRTVVELTEIRVERVQDISEEDARAEGIHEYGIAAVHDFMLIWESINGKGSWKQNPYVWVLSFRKVEP